MQVSRRKFIMNSSLAMAGTLLLPDNIFAYKKAMQTTMGIQLYSLRDDMKADPLVTLKKLYAMGYKNVEHANYIDRHIYTY